MRLTALAMTAGWLFSTISMGSQVAAPLRPYVTCHFEDGVAIVQKEPTPMAASGRTAMTLVGPKQVTVTRGERILFAYSGKDPFARATIEQMPSKSFAQDKQNLVSAFDKQIASHDDVQRNYSLKPSINGYEAHGLDRKEIGGTVQGVYLLIDDANHTVISFDFLNGPEANRSFPSLGDYATMRDGLLAGYSACVRANLRAAASTAVAPPRKPEPVKKAGKKQ